MVAQLIGGFQGRSVLAEEHRRIEFEVVVVAAVEGVEIDRPFLFQVFAVGLDRPAVGDHGAAVIAAEHVDVRRHMAQVSGVRHQVAQDIAGAQRPFRVRRHFHGVDVHVQHAGVRRIAVLLHALQRPLQHGHRLEGVGARCRLPGFQVPQLPGRAVDQRFGKQRNDVGIIGKGR